MSALTDYVKELRRQYDLLDRASDRDGDAESLVCSARDREQRQREGQRRREQFGTNCKWSRIWTRQDLRRYEFEWHQSEYGLGGLDDLDGPQVVLPIFCHPLWWQGAFDCRSDWVEPPLAINRLWWTTGLDSPRPPSDRRASRVATLLRFKNGWLPDVRPYHARALADAAKLGIYGDLLPLIQECTEAHHVLRRAFEIGTLDGEPCDDGEPHNWNDVEERWENAIKRLGAAAPGCDGNEVDSGAIRDDISPVIQQLAEVVARLDARESVETSVPSESPPPTTMANEAAGGDESIDPQSAHVVLTNEDRDAWLYDQLTREERGSLVKQDVVIERLKKQCDDHGWSFSKEIKTLKNAADRWAKRNNKPLIPRRNHGRPRTKKR